MMPVAHLLWEIRHRIHLRPQRMHRAQMIDLQRLQILGGRLTARSSGRLPISRYHCQSSTRKRGCAPAISLVLQLFLYSYIICCPRTIRSRTAVFRVGQVFGGGVPYACSSGLPCSPARALTAGVPGVQLRPHTGIDKNNRNMTEYLSQ